MASANVTVTVTHTHEHQELHSLTQASATPTPPPPPPQPHDHSDHHHHHHHQHHHHHHLDPDAATTTVAAAAHPGLYDDSTLASSIPVTEVAHHGLQALQAASAAPMSPASNELAQQYAQSAALQMGEPQFSSSLPNPILAAPLHGNHASQKVTRLRRACDMCSQRKVKVCQPLQSLHHMQHVDILLLVR